MQHELICHADFTSFWVSYAVGGMLAAILSAVFMKNLPRLRTAVRGHKGSVLS